MLYVKSSWCTGFDNFIKSFWWKLWLGNNSFEIVQLILCVTDLLKITWQSFKDFQWWSKEYFIFTFLVNHTGDLPAWYFSSCKQDIWIFFLSCLIFNVIFLAYLRCSWTCLLVFVLFCFGLCISLDWKRWNTHIRHYVVTVEEQGHES